MAGSCPGAAALNGHRARNLIRVMVRPVGDS